MDWKKTITSYIDQGDKEGLLDCGKLSLNKTLRYIQMNIWGDARQIRRWRAIEALEWLGEVLAWAHEEEFRNLIRRCLWAMNDESGNVPWAAPEVMAAVISAQPQLYGEFVPMLVTNGLDNGMCHQGVAWAVTKLWPVQAEKLTPFLPKLPTLLQSNDSEVRGYAAVMSAKIAEADWQVRLQALRQDEGLCHYYHQGVLQKYQVGELVNGLLEGQVKP